MSRSKDIGTRAETAVVKYLRANGFPLADRLPLKGSKDIGDVGDGTGAVVFEIKAGRAAETASDKQIGLWLEETLTEKDNAHADHGVLVVKRAGKGEAQVGKWWAIVWSPAVLGGPFLTQRYLLEEYLQHLRYSGYGDPLD